jgi:4-diphosphocytidyl-2-C-methyl-D-erythritol kinase
MIDFPNAKINVGLFVTGKREDGFHNIESIFLPVNLCDALEVVKNPEDVFDFEISGLQVDGKNEDNICFKAYRLLKSKYNIGGVKAALYKKIPLGAGLGGGSADGAFMLKLLNSVFEIGLGKKELMALAAQLGSDCPFFIDNTPSFVTGRGEMMEPIAINLQNHYVVLVNPGIHVNTGEAYKQISIQKPNFDLTKLNSIPLSDWRNYLYNSFEKPIAKQYQVINEIREKLYAHGAKYAAMSGSGSTVFGIFSERKKLKNEFGSFFCETIEILG